VSEEDQFSIDSRNRVKRRPKRASYDRRTVFEILDAGLICHIAYVLDGQPFCTPTSYWREGDHLYWHGSAASRMLRHQVGERLPVCLTVTHLDALTLARSGFNHAVNYRSVMAYGKAEICDGTRKEELLIALVDRIYPGRSRQLRAATRKEIAATTIVGMEIEQASAKVRDVMMGDDEEDYGHPVWTSVIKVETVLGQIIECPRQMPGMTKPVEMANFRTGRRLDIVLAEAYQTTFHEDEHGDNVGFDVSATARE
jgi:nitroimidazol reductase NimA-like FMN-containing flavoprotein (pyridoxamine 5'-phosphate oxidase superfamily)